MAKQSHLNQTIKAYLKLVAEKYKIDKAILFGSHARGTATRHSDIDLAIFSPTVKNELQAFNALSDLIRLTRTFKVAIDPMLFPTRFYKHFEKGDFVHEIRRSGKAIRI